MSMPIRVEGLTKHFGSFQAVNEVSFTAAAGSITAALLAAWSFHLIDLDRPLVSKRSMCAATHTKG